MDRHRELFYEGLYALLLLLFVCPCGLQLP